MMMTVDDGRGCGGVHHHSKPVEDALVVVVGDGLSLNMDREWSGVEIGKISSCLREKGKTEVVTHVRMNEKLYACVY